MNHRVLVTGLLAGVSGVAGRTSLSRDADALAGDPADARRRERDGGLTAV
jgi:hypothetical protein